MTTYEYGRSLLSETRAKVMPQVRTRLARAWGRFRPLALPVTGTGCFVGAAFTVSTMAGLIVAGLACFFVEWRAAK